MVTCLGFSEGRRKTNKFCSLFPGENKNEKSDLQMTVSHRTILALAQVENGDLESTKYNYKGFFQFSLVAIKHC